jgi:hypothetical protein
MAKLEIKVELSVVAVPLPKEREAAYWQAIRILAKMIRARAAQLMTEQRIA